MSGIPEDLVPAAQAAAALGVRPGTVRRWVGQGRLRGWQVGRTLWVPAADLAAFRASGRVAVGWALHRPPGA